MTRRLRKVVTLRSAAASARFADLTATNMSRTTRNRSTPPEMQIPINNGETAGQADSLGSTSNATSGPQLVKEMLLNSLNDVEIKVTELEDVKEEIESLVKERQEAIDQVKHSLKILLRKVGSEARYHLQQGETNANNVSARETFCSNALAALDIFVQDSEGTVRSSQRSKEILADLAKARERIAKLEKAIAVADPCGADRVSEEKLSKSPSGRRPHACCDICDKRTTVRLYPLAGPDSGLLCTKCGNKLMNEAKKDDAAEKKKTTRTSRSTANSNMERFEKANGVTNRRGRKRQREGQANGPDKNLEKAVGAVCRRGMMQLGEQAFPSEIDYLSSSSSSQADNDADTDYTSRTNIDESIAIRPKRLRRSL